MNELRGLVPTMTTLAPRIIIFLAATIAWIVVFARAQASGMDPAEKEAFYQVMESLNFEWDWRRLLPDPCGENTLQGMICDSDEQPSSSNSSIHLVGLSLGTIQSNTPSCSANASIHPAIAKLSHLRSLAFHGCFKQSPVAIPPSLASLAALSSLTFQNNPTLRGPIPAELGALANLERLILLGNGLAGEIPPQLGDLAALRQLVVSQNPGIQGAVPRTLNSLSNLVILDLSHNALDSLPDLSLDDRLAGLRKLDLSKNRINQSLASLGSLPRSLELLDLSGNRFSGTLPSALLGLVSLKELYLQGNAIEGEIPALGWDRLGASLISLDLSDCGLRGAIPDDLGGLARLRFLGLARNALAGAIPPRLARLDALGEIDLSGNRLSGAVPFAMGSIKRLGSKIKLGGNAGLCYPPGIFSMLDSSLDSMEGVVPCDKSTLPVAFQVGSYSSPSPSSSSSSSFFSGNFSAIVAIAIAIASFFVLR